MSTKIYYAYRLPKKIDILTELKKAKDIATEIVAKDGGYLEMLHALFMWDISHKIKKEPENEWYKNIIEENKNGNFRSHLFYFITFLEKNTNSSTKENLSGKFECSIFYDNDYWYIKFFPNESIQYKMIDEIEKNLNLEDFHYQNQTDPPNNINEKEFELRKNKWEELLDSSGGNYTDGFTYEIMNPKQIQNLLSKFFYTGKPLFEHLNYKFDKVFFKDNIGELDDNV